MSSLPDNILRYLVDHPSSTAKDIAVAVIGSKAVPKDVNPTLYSLLSKKEVSIETSSPPRWTLANKDNNKTESVINQDEIVKCITEHQPISALNIARKVIDKNSKAKNINPTLYRMQKDGIIHCTDSTPPLWSMMDEKTVLMNEVTTMLSKCNLDQLQQVQNLITTFK